MLQKFQKKRFFNASLLNLFLDYYLNAINLIIMIIKLKLNC